MSDIRMPSLGADMTHGTLVAWHVKPGDRIARGDLVAEVETQKGAFSVDARVEGVVEELLAVPGTRVPVGASLARLSTPQTATASAPAGGDLSQKVSEHEEHAAVTGTTTPSSPPTVSATTDAPAAIRQRATPLARRVAAQLGVDLGQVTASGENGVITRGDVERAANRRVEAPAPRTHSGMRAAIAAAMTRSKREIPHYYLSHEIDMGVATEWLTMTNAARDVHHRLLSSALLLKATARAAHEYQEFNGFFVDGAFVPARDVHLGVAIALREGGLIAPALHDADTLTLDDLNTRLVDLVRRARQGGLTTSEVGDPTQTVTILGDPGVQSVIGVIYPPQVALVGFGMIATRPWAEAGMLGVRPQVTLTLAADHRASDGHRGALFLRAIEDHLLHPEAL